MITAGSVITEPEPRHTTAGLPDHEPDHDHGTRPREPAPRPGPAPAAGLRDHGWPRDHGIATVPITRKSSATRQSSVIPATTFRDQALAAGIGFTELSNGFAPCDDPALLQRICDSFGRGSMTGLLNRPYSMNQASYDLTRLARNGLITRVGSRR